MTTMLTTVEGSGGEGRKRRVIKRFRSDEIGDTGESECVGLDDWEEKSEGEYVGNIDNMGRTNPKAKIAAIHISREALAALPV